MNVNDLKNWVLMALAAIGSFIAHALGGWDAAMILLVALMGVDYITGVLLAAIWHKSTKTESGRLSSVAGFKGLIKKIAILLMVWIAVLLDSALKIDYVRMAVILFFIGNEGLSLLENLGLMGVPFPAFLKNMLEALKEKGDSGEDAKEPEPEDEELDEAPEDEAEKDEVE